MIRHELLGAKGSQGRMASSSNGKSLTGSQFKTEHVCSATSDFLSPFPPLFAGSSSASPMTSGNVTTEEKKPKNFTHHQWHRVFSGGIDVMRQFAGLFDRWVLKTLSSPLSPNLYLDLSSFVSVLHIHIGQTSLSFKVFSLSFHANFAFLTEAFDWNTLEFWN